jgi:hypothetical protein
MMFRSDLEVTRTSLGDWKVIDDGLTLARGSTLDYVVGRVDQQSESWPLEDQVVWQHIRNKAKRKHYLGLPF